jgi:hypothetical protein
VEEEWKKSGGRVEEECCNEFNKHLLCSMVAGQQQFMLAGNKSPKVACVANIRARDPKIQYCHYVQTSYNRSICTHF